MSNVVRIFEQQYETLKKLPKKDQAKMALAMLDFAFTGAVSVELNYIQDLALTPMKPSLKVTQTGGCPKGIVRNPAGLNQYSEVKGYPNPNPNPLVKGLVKPFINNNTLSSISSSSSSNNNSGNNINNLSTTRAREFVPPTLQEVLTYAKSQNDMAGCGGFACSKAIAEEFWANYEANGWIVGNESRTPVRDWKAKLRQWCARERQRGQ